MYREMSAEEKLTFSSEMIEAIKKDGLLGSLEVVEKYKQLLSQHDIVEPPLEENILPDEVSIKETHQQNTSIYATEIRGILK